MSETEPDDDRALPRRLQLPERDADWDRPTAWLLGAQVLGSLKNLMLSQLHRGFDVRDWMTPTEIKLGKDTDQEFWIDYLSDTGDSPRLVYWLAYLLQQPALTVDGKTLPRGAALVIGGDTAYPVADKLSLGDRVCAPFIWARQRLRDEHKLDPKRIPLFGVPGNHDYYDMLDGFNGQFRALGTLLADDEKPSLQLPGYERQQSASYFVLQLPGQWELWGIDCEMGIDPRQARYFTQRDRPANLIVATSRPMLVRGALAAEDDPVIKACAKVELPEDFRAPSKTASDLRLDLSGDVHVYERYYGSAATSPARPPAEQAPSSDRYASVVCGLGGAFHHPTQVRHGPMVPQASFPDPNESADAMARLLLNPLRVFQAGSAGVIGMLLAAMLYLLASASAHDASILDLPRLWLRPAHTTAIPEVLSNFVRVFGFMALILGNIFLLWGAITWTRKVRARMAESADDWHVAFLYRTLQRGWGRSVLDVFGANPRITYSVLLTTPLWLLTAAYPFGMYFLARQEDLGFNLYRDGVALDVVLVLLLAGFTALGYAGGWNLRSKLSILVYGLVHGVVQAFAPFSWTLLLLTRPVVAIAVGAGIGFGGYLLGRIVLSIARQRSAKTAKWIRRVGFTFLGLAITAALLLLPACLSSVPRAGTSWALGTVLSFVIVGSIFTCMLLGWYFLIVLQWHAHGNEAGSVARIDEYGAFLRMRLTADAAEVWAIAPEVPAKHARGKATYPIGAKVVDHFVIRRAQPKANQPESR